MLYYSQNVDCNCKVQGSEYWFPFINLYFRSENVNGESVKENKVADWVFGILYFLVFGFLEFYEKISVNIPASEFAFSLGLSPSAGMY